MAGRLEFDFTFKRGDAAGRRRDEDEPMRILVLADLSGRDARGIHESSTIAARALQKVDIDTFDDVLNRIGPTLPWSGAAEPLAFRVIEDFHPDELYETLPIFSRLRDLRKKLLSTPSAAEAMAELGSVLSVHHAESAAPAGEGEAPSEDDSSTIERLLGAKPSGDAPRAAAAGAGATSVAGAVDALIAKIVAPHIVPDAPPHRDAYVDAVTNALAEHMRSVLHHPAFQAIESTWRSVHLLVSELGGEETIEIHLLDVTRRELAEDLEAAGGDLERTQIYAALVTEAERRIGPAPWSLLIGAYRFEPAEEHLRLLAALGALASRCGGPLVAEGDARAVGCESLAASPDSTKWAVAPDVAEVHAALRASPAASWVGLALPRVILRQPYGVGSDEIDSFDFEEMTPANDHETYLWGNPAFAVALLVGRAFIDNGWEMEPGDELDLSDLPSHVYASGGEKKTKPCAEVLLSDRAVDVIIKAGLMPMVSFRNRNAVRAERLQSVASPSAALSGPWG